MRKSRLFYVVTLGLIVAMLMGLASGCTTEEPTDTGDNGTTNEQTKKDEKPLKAKNLRVVIGSTSTGGDTYQSTSIMAKRLEEEIGVNVKVDAVGASNGFDALKRTSDGSTIMVFHDMAYLGYLYGKEGYTDIFEDYKIGPTLAINPGNAFAAAKNSDLNSIEDVIAKVGAGEEVRVAIQPGGVSEIGYSALKNAIKLQYPGMEENLVAINTGSQADKNQALFDGQADVINASVQANEQYTNLPADDQKAMKFLWLTAREETIKGANEEGFGDTTREQLLKYVEPNAYVAKDASTNFTFDKEFFVLYNKDMSDELVEYFDEALTNIFDAGEIHGEYKEAFFIPNFKPSSEAESYLKDKVGAYETIINAIK